MPFRILVAVFCWPAVVGVPSRAPFMLRISEIHFRATFNFTHLFAYCSHFFFVVDWRLCWLLPGPRNGQAAFSGESDIVAERNDQLWIIWWKIFRCEWAFKCPRARHLTTRAVT